MLPLSMLAQPAAASVTTARMPSASRRRMYTLLAITTRETRGWISCYRRRNDRRRAHPTHGGRGPGRVRAVLRSLRAPGLSAHPPYRPRCVGRRRRAAGRLLGGVAARGELRSGARHTGGVDL